MSSDYNSQLSEIPYTKTKSVKVDSNILRNNRIIAGLKNDPRADIYRVLRTNILRKLRENDWNSFGITSATPGTGKTSVTINLAIALSMELNQTVLVVDVDLKRPMVAFYLGLEVEYGLLAHHLSVYCKLLPVENITKMRTDGVGWDRSRNWRKK
jgi:Mrp family chromosome partitioning ATPase